VLGRTAWIAPAEPVSRTVRGSVLIVTAGTSDLPVAEEAAVTAAAFGNPVERLTDVGVAGIHRLLARGTVCAPPPWSSWSRGWRARSPPSSAAWCPCR
jgi:NCAIR mutase (PurE)-related protein